MNKRFKKLAGGAIAGMAMLFPLGAYAVPAQRVPMIVTNPDGSTVTLTKVGDEFFHCFLTEDGYPVRADEQGWYRIVDNSGKLSQIRAYDPADREPLTNAMMRSVSPQVAYTSLQELTLSGSTMYKSRMAEQARKMRRAVETADDEEWDYSDGHDLRKFPCEGEQKVLIVLVNFANMKFSFDSDPHQAVLDAMTQPGYSAYGGTGSAYDFYTASSDGKFKPSFDVYGPVDLKYKYSYYGQNDMFGQDMRAGDMVLEACEALDGEIDFSQYDRDHDGYVDCIYVIYAGHGEATYRDANTIWPHSFNLNSALGYFPELDGVKLNYYACSAELNGDGDFDGIGTFCHEFGHVLGLPDLYCTDYGSAKDKTPGEFSAMDYGPYNNNSRTPPLFSAYEKYSLHWLNPVVIEDNREVVLPPMTRNNCAYKIKSGNKDTEYFLFENRQLESWDTYIPASGMLVWHIDFDEKKWGSNSVNNFVAHQNIDLVEADGTATASKGADTFPGLADAFDFDESTKPQFVNWAKKSTGFSLNTIEQNADGSISFNVKKTDSESAPVAYATPLLHYTGLDSNGFTACWSKVDGAVDYLLTVYPLEEALMPAEVVGEFVENYRMQSMKGATETQLTGLEPGIVYYVGVNAVFADGVSRPAQMLVTIPDGSEPDDMSPRLFATDLTGVAATLQWDKVGDASEYELTVARRENTVSTSVEKVGFDGSKLPEGWEKIGTFNIEEGNYGEAAPSLCFNYTADTLQSCVYENEISSLTFWTKFNIQGPRARIDVYGTAVDGSIHLVDRVYANAESETYTVNFPAGMHQFAIYYYGSKKDQILYVDDFALTFTSDHKDTPVAGYDMMTVNGTACVVEGLEPETDYVAYARVKGMETRYNVLAFNSGKFSGVQGVENSTSCIFTVRGGVVIPALQDVEYDIYAMDGRMVASGVRGNYALAARGMYIVRSGRTVQKLVY